MSYIHSISIANDQQYLIEPLLFATAGGTSTDLTASITNFTLVTGAYVHLKVQTVDAQATLNVNNTGKKDIYYNGLKIKANVLSEGNTYIFIYTGTYWEVLGDITGKNIMIGTTAEWQAQRTFIAPAGTILIYTDYHQISNGNNIKAIPGIKISDGVTPGIDAAFIDEDTRNELFNHINDSVSHITSSERTSWNNKVSAEINGETLILDNT